MASDYSLGTASIDTEIDLTGLRSGIDAAEQEARAGFAQIGSVVGGALSTALTVGIGAVVTAIAAIGGAALDVAGQTDQATRTIQAQLGATAEEAERLGQVALTVFGDNWYGSVEEAGQVVALLRQQLGDLADEELRVLAGGVAAIGDNFEAEAPAVIQAIKAIRDNFPGTTEAQALDIITAGFQRGLNASGDFLETITEYAPQFRNGGADAAQFFSILDTGLSTGVLGTDKAGDLFKEFVVRINDGSKLTAESLASLGFNADKMLADLATGTIRPIDAFAMVLGALKSTDNQALLMQAGVGLLGTQFEDLGAAAVTSIDTAAIALTDLDGATNSLGVKYGSIGDVIGAAWRTALVELEPFGSKLLDLANSVLPDVTAALQTVIPAIAGPLTSAVDYLATVVIPGLIAGWQAIAPAVQMAGSVISSLASDAYTWGSNIVISLANGISGAIGSVVAALGDVGSVVAYWLQPGSPPRLLPDIDVWGTGAAAAWAEGFADADLGAFDALSGKIESVLRGMAASGAIPEEGMIPAIIGSRQAVAAALAELERTGTISEDSFAAIRASAGEAGADVEELTRRYLALRQASERTTDAQAELDAALQAQAELGDQVMIPLVEKEAAAARVTAAREALKTAKDGEAQAKGQYDAQQRLIDQQIKTNALLQEQRRLEEEQATAQEQAAKGAGAAAAPKNDRALEQAKRDAEAAAKAQEAYNLSVADSDGKLEILRARLAKLNPSQAEYWQTLSQIAAIESQQAKESERNAQKEIKDQEAVTKAQRDHEYAVASNSEKLAILKQRLAELTPDQAEYWQTLTQIAQVEGAIARESQGAAGGAAALGGATAAALTPLREIPGAAGPATEATATFGKEQSTVAAAVSSARAQIEATFGGLFTNVQGVWQAIAGAVVSKMHEVAGAVTEIMPFIQYTIETALGEVQTFWNAHGATILAFVNTTWEQIGSIISVAIQLVKVIIQGTLALIAVFIQEHGTAIQAVFGGVWMAIQGIVQTVISAIEVIIRTALALISGDWNTQLGAIKAAGERMFGGIKLFIIGVLETIAGFFDTSLTEIFETWDFNFRAIAKVGEEVFGPAVDAVTAKLEDLKAFWTETLIPAAENVKKMFDDTLKGAIDRIKGPLEDLAKWWQGISDAIADLVGRVADFKESIQNVKIPDWLKGHSPPPLADWFQYSADAAGALNAELPELAGGLAGPALPSLAGAPAAASASARITVDDRGVSWLRELIRVEVQTETDRAAATAASRGRLT